ncbi:MAG: hypothetical protein VZS44_01545 [Bacilli bacterium]|nr:hypothetical protein [Bacilli bacterium]
MSKQNKYDIILKEKKVYTDENENDSKILKRFIRFGFFISFIIIIICYVVYYNTILNNESIVLNNISNLQNEYQIFYKSIIFDYDLDNNYLIEGKMDIGNESYNYSFAKQNNQIRKNIFLDKKSMTYYTDGSDNYFKLTALGDFYVRDNNNIKLNDLDYYDKTIKDLKEDFNKYLYSNILDKNANEIFKQLYNIDNFNRILTEMNKNYQTSITNDKYIRKIYLEDNKPIIEVSTELTKDNINSILSDTNLEIKDDYKVNITMKNHAITNNVEYIKAIIKNNTTDNREVIEYKKDLINYTDGKDKYKLRYDRSQNNIKINKNGVLYSVIQITSKNNVNIYSYKVIDKIYTINLSVAKTDSKFEYSIETNIDNVAKAIKISGDYFKKATIDENTTKAVNVEALNNNQKQIYNASMQKILK